MHQHPRAGAPFSHTLCSQSSTLFIPLPLGFSPEITRMIYQNQSRKNGVMSQLLENPRRFVPERKIKGRRGKRKKERERKRKTKIQTAWNWVVERAQGSVSARNFLGNRIGHNLEYLFSFGRKLHLPFNACRSLVLTCCVLLHSRGNPICTVNALTAVYRGPYEKRDVALAFPEKEKRRKRRKKRRKRAELARARVRPFHREFYSPRRTS